MPTEVVKIVDPGGTGDYASLSGFEAGEQRNLYSADEIAVAKCRCTNGNADTTSAAFYGWTTDPTHYIKIWTDPTEGYRHPGYYPTSGNYYRMNVTDANAITLGNAPNAIHAVIIGIALKVNLSSTNANVISVEPWGSGSTLLLSHCVMAGGSVSGSCILRGMTVYDPNHGGVKAYNNVIHDIINGSNWCYGLDLSSGSNHYVYNNTIYACGIGIRSSGNVVAKNNIVASCAVDHYYGTFASGTDYNATDSSDDVGQGSHNRTNQTFSFVNASGRDLHLTASDTGAKGYGTDLSSDSYLPFSDDIDGQTRSTPWDIGADQYVAAGGSSSIAAIMWHLKQQRIM